MKKTIALSPNEKIESMNNNNFCFIKELSLHSYDAISRKATVNVLECLCLILGIGVKDLMVFEQYKQFCTTNTLTIFNTIIKAIESHELLAIDRGFLNKLLGYGLFSPTFFLRFLNGHYNEKITDHTLFIKDLLQEVEDKATIIIKTSDFLEWALQQPFFLLSRKLYNTYKHAEIILKKINKPERNKIINQTIAQVLWCLDPWKSKKNIEVDIKTDPVLSNYGTANDYTGTGTFSKWLVDIDSRISKNKNPKIACKIKNNLSYEIKVIPKIIFYQNNQVYIKDLLRLKLILKYLTKTLKYKGFTLDEIENHALIKAYTGNISEATYQILLNWIQQSFS